MRMDFLTWPHWAGVIHEGFRTPPLSPAVAAKADLNPRGSARVRRHWKSRLADGARSDSGGGLFGSVRSAYPACRCNHMDCRYVTDSVTLRIVIKTFRHKGLAALFETGNARKVQPKHAKRLNLILTALNAATQAAQMAMPGMRFHPLHGDRYSVWVDENYRVTFRFQGGHAYEVDYEDYH